MKRYIGIALFFAAIASAQPTPVLDGRALNAASYTMPVAPGSLVQIYGTNLGSTLASADTVPFSTTLGGVSVTFNGISAPMKDVVPATPLAALNVQMPFEVLPAGQQSATVNMVVKVNGVSSDPKPIPVAQIAPGVFTKLALGTGYAIAVTIDGKFLAAPPSLSASLGYPTRPVKPGESIFFYATGLGAMTPAVANGAASPVGVANVTPVVLIGGMTAHVDFAGQAPGYPGVNQINVIVPPNAPIGDSVSLQIQVGGITTTDKVVIAVGQ